MSNRTQKLTQADICRAVKGCRQAGVEIGAVRISPDNREIIITPLDPSQQQASISDIDKLLDMS